MSLPKKKFSVGAIQVAVWENESKDGNKFSTVSIDRSYKDKKDEWKKTTSLRQADLPKAVLALQKAYEWISLKEPEIGEKKEQMLATAVA